MWKILICSEDEKFMQELGHRIRRLAGERVKEIRLFSKKEDLDFYTTGRPEESDIILIDISVDNGGIQLAQKVLAVQPHSQIIFMASTDKYYLDVYSVDHVYFLKKPIEPVFLMKALNKAGSRLQDLKKSYLVISNKQASTRSLYIRYSALKARSERSMSIPCDREISITANSKISRKNWIPGSFAVTTAIS